eukprot:UN10275
MRKPRWNNPIKRYRRKPQRRKLRGGGKIRGQRLRGQRWKQNFRRQTSRPLIARRRNRELAFTKYQGMPMTGIPTPLHGQSESYMLNYLKQTPKRSRFQRLFNRLMAGPLR